MECDLHDDISVRTIVSVIFAVSLRMKRNAIFRMALKIEGSKFDVRLGLSHEVNCILRCTVDQTNSTIVTTAVAESDRQVNVFVTI